MHRSLPCRATCACLAGLLILLPALRSSAAQRQRPTSVVVAPYAALAGVPGHLAAKVTLLVAAELSGRAALKAVAQPSSSTIARAAPDFEKVLSQARAALAQGRDLALQGKAAAAADVLARAVGGLAGRPGALDAEGGKLLAELTEALAAERLATNDEDGADAALAALVRLAPERPVPSGSFPAGFLRAFKSVQRRTLGQTRGTLRVAAPRGAGPAQVSLDGRLLRAAPVLLKDVLPGDHFLRVERNGEVWAERVTVLAGSEAAVAPQLGDRAPGPAGDLLAALQAGELDRAALGKAGKLAKTAKAEAVVLGAVARQGDGYTVRSYVWFARSGRLLQLAVMTLDGELHAGSLEVLRVADDLVRKLTRPGSDSALPVSLGTPAAEAATGALAEVSVAPPAPAETADPTIVTPLPDLPPQRTAAAPEAAAVRAPAAPTAVAPTPAAAPQAASVVAAPVVAAATPMAKPAAAARARELVIPRSPTGTAQLEATPRAVERTPNLSPSPSRGQAVEAAALAVPRDEQPAPKNRTALWIVLGVVGASALGASGYLLWQGSRTPSTATLNASWTH